MKSLGIRRNQESLDLPSHQAAYHRSNESVLTVVLCCVWFCLTTDASGQAIGSREGPFDDRLAADLDGDGRADGIEPVTIVVCIHGVMVTDAVASWSDFTTNVFHAGLPDRGAHVILNWGYDWPWNGSQTVGHRHRWARKGMSMHAWRGVDKLKQTVAKIDEAVPASRITLLCHSQGSVIALGALAGGGLAVDKVVFLGSPLGRRSLSGMEDNTRFAAAFSRVRTSFVNLASEEDDIARHLPPDLALMRASNAGIGYAGLPEFIAGVDRRIPHNGLLQVAVTTGTPKTLGNYVIDGSVGVQHHGSDGWLRFKWLRSGDVSVASPKRAILDALVSPRPLHPDEAMRIRRVQVFAATPPALPSPD